MNQLIRVLEEDEVHHLEGHKGREALLEEEAVLGATTTFFTPTSSQRPQRQNENRSPVPSIPDTDTTIDLKPKALATTESPLRNDSMWQDFDDDGFDGLTPYFCRNEFAVTTEVFLAIAEREDDVILSADRTFGKFVSKTMFVWYLTMHLYARMIAIRNHQDLNSFEENRFLDYVRSNNYPVPAPVQEYLKSIGDMRDMAGTEYKLAFPVWPNVQGHFGPVDQDTHVFYESMPAHLVCAERIRHDLEYTLHPEINPTSHKFCGLKEMYTWKRILIELNSTRSERYV